MKKNRILALLLAAIMVVGLLPMAAMAAGEPVTFTVEADKSTVDQDGKITFTVSIQATEPVASYQVYLVIPEGLTYVEGSGKMDAGAKAALGLTGSSDDCSFTESAMMLMAGGEANMNATNKTKLMTFECTAPKGGDFSVTINPKEVTDANFEKLTVGLVPAAVHVNKTRQTLGTLTLAYDKNAIAISGDKLTDVATPTVTAKDDEGDAMDLSKVTNLTFVTDPATLPAGVSIAADGKITVDKTVAAEGATVKVKAKAGSVESNEITINVTKEAAVATTVEIAGATTALIPAEGADANTYTYTAKVFDQYGAEMSGQDVTLTAAVGETGATFATDTLTVPAGVAGGEVTITATCGTVSNSVKVNVTDIAFDIAKDAIVAKDGVYGDKLGDLVTVDGAKITATAGAAVAGKYTVKDAETVPNAADTVAWEVVFNSDNEVYKDVTVATGEIKVAKKEVTVTADDVDVRVGGELVAEDFTYTVKGLVGEDKLTGTVSLTVNGQAPELTSTDEADEFTIVITGLTDESGNYDVKLVNGTLTVKKRSLILPTTPVNPDDPDDNKPVDGKIDFVDVDDEDWFAEAVDFVVTKGLFKGVSETEFAPNNDMTRAMVATVLYRLDGEHKTDVAAAFEDVAADTWYTEGVAWAAEKGVVKGLSETEFAPDDNVTREQLATMLYRYVGEPEVDAEMGMAGFEDVETVSDWAEAAMRWAVQNEIIKGKDGARLDPQGNATRAEVATMLQRFVALEK